MALVFKAKPKPLGHLTPLAAPKPEGFNFLQGLKKKIHVRKFLHDKMAGWEKARDHSYIHASDLMKELEYCPREFALLDLTKKTGKDSYLSASQVVTYAHGHDLEDHIRNEWLRDLAVGYWKCGVCSQMSKNGNGLPLYGKAPKIKCKNCGWGHQWKYEEVRFGSEATGISGGIDLILDVGEAKHRLVEIKTMAPEKFKTLEGPMAEHRFRTTLYLKLVEESILPEAASINTKTGHILYVAKSFGFKDMSLHDIGVKDYFTPFKEYQIERDDTLLTVSEAKATVLTQWRNNPKIGLPCGVCKNGLEQRAQKCPAVSACFSGKFPAQITWLHHGKPKHDGKKLVE